MKLAYPAIITYCEEDNNYSIEFPDLQGCVSGGHGNQFLKNYITVE